MIAVVVIRNDSFSQSSPDQTIKTFSEPIRFITATSLYDGHDASINIVRRLLQSQGAEVIHLGHNRSVNEVVIAALQEDTNAIAVSSYQGGHNEYFSFMIEQLQKFNAGHIRVFGGGGGVIRPEEITALQEKGVERIYTPENGRDLGLDGMAADMIQRVLAYRTQRETLERQAIEVKSVDLLVVNHYSVMARNITASENGKLPLQNFSTTKKPHVIGISGTGGAGKSSFIDEILLRFKIFYPELKIALVSVDPTRRKTGGALLGDRLRMNSVNDGSIYMRSLATRSAQGSLSRALGSVLSVIQPAGFDIVIIESAGTGQSDTSIADYSDTVLYVMTPEFGAQTQLEKIGMLDYAHCIILNKSDRERSADALNAIRKQYRRNKNDFNTPDHLLPVIATISSRFADVGVDTAFHLISEKCGLENKPKLPQKEINFSGGNISAVIPGKRKRYLSEISEAVRNYHNQTEIIASEMQKLQAAETLIGLVESQLQNSLQNLKEETEKHIPAEILHSVRNFSQLRSAYAGEKYSYKVRGKEIQVDSRSTSLSKNHIPKVSLPDTGSYADRAKFLREENVPGEFPYTAGVFPFKREGEDPTRMFAGEGGPERTNRRFHFISGGQSTVRLSTAFDSITLYGEDPALRPDIYGKIGNAGVSIATVDDMKKLYSGFDLCAPGTSVSMTINGPAPAILAFFFQTAIDQQVELYLKNNGKWPQAQNEIAEYFSNKGIAQPHYLGDLPEGHNRLGLALLGISGDLLVSPQEYGQIQKRTLATVRGTVQADILKEDQAQNTCIFSTEFALRMMGDIQEFFNENEIANFYSVSISGYHIAEAGANPITQVAFTLANGFTLLEYYLSRGMCINTFARNLSFFFSNGMDPEYAVIGRAARRIWAIALRNLYQADERAQKLKYHIQTSGRSLHAQEMAFNDIRTTLQALYAIMDNCNSLHTNAYDEAITTPTPESVRRAIAIQLIINRELGLTKNENPLQGSYFITELTNLVEEAILQEFDSLSERGGVPGSMESMYQRMKIQEESLYYEHLKMTGEYPIIGVNTWLGNDKSSFSGELMRSSDDEKQDQLSSLELFRKIHKNGSTEALKKLKDAALLGKNTFTELMNTVKHSTLGEISTALYSAGGAYRRSM